MALPGETQEERERRVMRERTLRQLEVLHQENQTRLQRPLDVVCGGKVVCTPQAVAPITAPDITDLTNTPAIIGALGGLGHRF